MKIRRRDEEPRGDDAPRVAAGEVADAVEDVRHGMGLSGFGSLGVRVDLLDTSTVGTPDAPAHGGGRTPREDYPHAAT